jgi:hypothetical protein
MDMRDSMDIKKQPLFRRLKNLFSTDDIDIKHVGPTVNYTMGPSSGFNSTLLKDAINDAKVVRQTALANAKSALNAAFQNSIGSQSVPPLSLPGYSIAFSSEPVDHFKDTTVGDFSKVGTDDDWSGAISGFCLAPQVSGKSGFYNTGYVYAPYIPLHMSGPVDAHGNPSPAAPSPLDATAKANKVVNDAMEKSKKILDKSMNKSASYAMPAIAPAKAPKSSSYISKADKQREEDSCSGAINKSSPLTRTGNIATVGFDVIIGRPQFSRQINAIDYNGEKIPLERYRDKIKMAINDFHKCITEKYGNEKPKYKISYGPMFDDKEIELTFTGLMFDNFKIIATFSYEEGRLKNDVEANKNLMGLLNEVGKNCEFFVTGDIEFDELHVLITEMKLESFNYNNRNNPGFNNVLFGI